MPTQIEWAQETWNPVTGCTAVSEGCRNCYARRFAKRLRGRYGYPADDPFRVTFHPDRMEQPRRWRKPRLVFVCSMGDLFHKDVDPSWRRKVFGIMREAPQHTFVVLTKRPRRLREFVERNIKPAWRGGYPDDCTNIWLGVSVEDQETADARIPILMQTLAAKRVVSYEPALGPVDWPALLWGAAAGDIAPRRMVDWLICGGETGPGARPMHPDWAGAARDACLGAEVPFFFKQWGWAAADGRRNRSGQPMLDGRTWDEVPR